MASGANTSTGRMASMTPTIEITAAATIEEAWHALRDRDAIANWHGWDSDELAAEITTIYFTDVTEDRDRGVLRLHGGDTVEVVPEGDGVRITLTRAPLSGDPSSDAYYEDVTEGWLTFLHQLRFALERRPGARRTIFLSSADAFGLGVITDLDLPETMVGTPYADVVVGARLSGEVWCSSEFQHGITVDEWHGLLIVSGMEPSDRHPEGTAQVILTTHGMPDADFAALERRWRAWWVEFVC